MYMIQGVERIDHRVYSDERGELVALERYENLPFSLKRVFFMRVDTTGAVRGGHANSCHEYLVALTGSVTVEVDNGAERTRVRLEGHGQALWIRPGILIHLRDFEPGTLLLVCASEAYEDTRHFAQPQPDLTTALCPA